MVASETGFDSWQAGFTKDFNPNPALLTVFCLVTQDLFSQQVCTQQRNVNGTKRSRHTTQRSDHSKHLSQSHEEEVDEKGADSGNNFLQASC